MYCDPLSIAVFVKTRPAVESGTCNGLSSPGLPAEGVTYLEYK